MVGEQLFDSLLIHGGLELDGSRGPSMLVPSSSGRECLVAVAQNPYIRSGWHAAEGVTLPPASTPDTPSCRCC